MFFRTTAFNFDQQSKKKSKNKTNDYPKKMNLFSKTDDFIKNDEFIK